MVNRLYASFLLLLGMSLYSYASIPVLRYLVGASETPELSFFTVIIFAIGGIMAALSSMILFIRRQPELTHTGVEDRANQGKATFLHLSGLTLYTGLPFANFLLAYFLWLKYRRNSDFLDQTGREVVHFQITWYLYVLLSLFLSFIFIGILTTLALIAFHLVVTLYNVIRSLSGKAAAYPANINISGSQPLNKR